MAAFNFQKRFADDVEFGRKVQTIRAKRKDGRPPCRLLGDLQLYTGMRTKACRKLRDAVCEELTPVIIGKNHAIIINGVVLETAADEDAFARADGFEDAFHMMNWFEDTHGLPFDGWLIKWPEIGLSRRNMEIKAPTYIKGWLHECVTDREGKA